MDLRQVSLEDKYSLNQDRAYLTGIEALTRLPLLQHQLDLERGLNTAGFISGYRGSPVGGVDQAMWRAGKHLAEHNIHFQPGVNEDLAATAVWGSQQTNLFEGARYDGVFSMWYGKGPGVDRSMDVIKHANAFGTSKYGGVLAVAGDDHACKSSTLPHQSEHMFIGASIPVLNPSNVQEVLDLGIFGWELSRYSGCWVALKAITENMDSAISADLRRDRFEIITPDGFVMPEDGVHARWPDRPLDQERRLNKFKIYAAREFARVNRLNRIVVDSERPRLGIMTTGKSYLDVMQALEDLGIDDALASQIGLRVFKVGMSWPLEPVATHEFARGLEEILVVEEKRSIMEDQLTGQLYNWPVVDRPRVVGEFDEVGRDLLPNLGELTPAMVARAIAARIERFYQSDSIDNRLKFLSAKENALAMPRAVAERVPHFCSGCPHNTSTKVPEGSMALGGIGCHYMATWMPDRNTQTFTQMGGEGATWLGQAPFTDRKHVFQNLGDGTYFHSGLLAIRAAVSAGVNITYKILYNDVVAMTGGQPIDGPMSVERMVFQLKGEGIERIAIVSVDPSAYGRKFPKFSGLTIHPRDDLDAVQREMREVTGTSVIIYQQTCSAERRRKISRGQVAPIDKRVVINSEVCEGCGDCSVQSNCLSILPKETELGRKRQIDQSSCNKDFSCVKGFCPSFVSVVGGSLRKSSIDPAQINFDDLPEPKLPALDRPWNTVVAGVGGTGVLTITALIAMAAHLEGKGCATMNQTGLAQKFGAVVSHVRVGATQEDIKAVRIPAGDADLLIGCDLAVAASAEALAKVATDRSSAVINSTESAATEFVLNPDAIFPTRSMQATLVQEVGEGKVFFAESSRIAIALMGDAIASNLFLLGYAWQRGLIPVSSGAIDAAIGLNGVAVEFNRQAFRWGRLAAHDIERLNALLAAPGRDSAEELGFDELLDERAERLTHYQDVAYADRYRTFVADVVAATGKLAELKGKALSRAVAVNLFKLMAYKDEYEVARLYSNGDFQREMKDRFEGDYKLRFHLAPPLFSRRDSATGHLLKREFPGWIRHGFTLLAKFKGLRGTAFDPFSYLAERRTERALIAEYQTLVTRLLPELDASNVDVAIAIAEVPQKIRGFGHVKDGAIANARTQWSELESRFREGPVDVVQIIEKVA
ncbi:MAG: indolepyruvate ferredoxin oxidoreductase [Halieaceae bacterium]|jgi:indolepyruvate ferredoxin oxidoreductase